MRRARTKSTHDGFVGRRAAAGVNSGGCQPRWSHDGNELFYVEGDTLVAVKVRVNPIFAVGEAQPLFADPSLGGPTWDYDVSADGRVVLVEDVLPEDELTRKPAIHIIENWYALLLTPSLVRAQDDAPGWLNVRVIEVKPDPRRGESRT